MPDYEALLKELSDWYSVEYKVRLEAEFLAQDRIPQGLQKTIRNYEFPTKYRAPSISSFAIRASCPPCGLVDKYGVRNTYSPDGSGVSFECPLHGRFSYSIERDAHHFRFNCQLFNPILGLFYENAPYNWIEICRSDYAGF